MDGGVKSKKNLVKLILFGVVSVVGIGATMLAARWLFFNSRVAPMLGGVVRIAQEAVLAHLIG